MEPPSDHVVPHRAVAVGGGFARPAGLLSNRRGRSLELGRGACLPGGRGAVDFNLDLERLELGEFSRWVTWPGIRITSQAPSGPPRTRSEPDCGEPERS